MIINKIKNSSSGTEDRNKQFKLIDKKQKYLVIDPADNGKCL